MEAIAEILNRTNEPTPTPTSPQSGYERENRVNRVFPGVANLAATAFDRTADTAITRLLSRKEDLSAPVERCAVCGEPKQKDLEILGEIKRLPIVCKCRVNELREAEKREEAAKTQKRLDRFRRYSLMDSSFENSTFGNWQFRVYKNGGNNRGFCELCRAYCRDWPRNKAANRGLLLFGGAGHGKTYASFVIANELFRQNETVLAISVSRVLRLIQDGYSRHGDDGAVGEMEIIEAAGEAGLLILDDLGTENRTYWSYDKLYALIDARYRAGKPLIITTNLDLDALRRNLALIDAKSGAYDDSERVYDRITQMCEEVEVTGDSWRVLKRVESGNQ